MSDETSSPPDSKRLVEAALVSLRAHLARLIAEQYVEEISKAAEPPQDEEEPK